MSFIHTFARLRLYVKNLSKDKPNLKEPDAFAYWFCQAALLHPDDDKAIRAGLCGKANDKNNDVITWSNLSHEVYICQTKFHQTLAAVSEKPNDVTSFAHIADGLSQPTEKKMNDCFLKANQRVKLLLAEVWRLMHKHNFKLRLFYVTTGKVSKALVEEAESIVQASHIEAEFMVYDGHKCCRIFESFENLVPAIPFVSIAGVETHITPSINAAGVKSAVFAVPVSQIKAIFDNHKERLFARNIRLFKGESAQTNVEIAETLRKRPEHFFYLNNGITILGSDIIESNSMSGLKVLRIFEPQIINGQQTTRTISKLSEVPQNAEVLVKVICRKPESDKEIGAFRNFIYSVVRATNSQTKINASELAANNPEQIKIERALQRLKWKYVRKAGKAEEESIYHDDDVNGVVTLKALATAVVVCERDPQYIRREGIETLFQSQSKSQHLYDKVFSDTKRDYDYLLCYLLFLLAKRKGKAHKKQAQKLAALGQYFVAYVMRQVLEPLYHKRPDELMAALSVNLKHRQFAPQLRVLSTVVMTAWQEFYRNRKDSDQDPLSFVSAKASKEAWWTYWKSFACSRHRKSAAKAVATILSAAKG